MPYIEFDASKVHYRIEGSEGPVLLLLSSLGTSTGMWDGVCAHLAKDFRLLRIDHPGHGLSEPVPEVSVDGLARRAIAVLDALGLAQVHCAGLSLGGMVAQRLGVDYPKRIASLTLCATAAILPTPEFWNARAELALAEGMAPFADLSPPRWFTPDFAHSPEAAAILDGLTEISAQGYAACCRAIAGFDATKYVRTITAPTKLIAGRSDPSTSVEMMSNLAGLIPGASLMILEQASHLLAVERAAETAAAIRAFVASHSALV